MCAVIVGVAWISPAKGRAARLTSSIVTGSIGFAFMSFGREERERAQAGFRQIPRASREGEVLSVPPRHDQIAEERGERIAGLSRRDDEARAVQVREIVDRPVTGAGNKGKRGCTHDR